MNRQQLILSVFNQCHLLSVLSDMFYDDDVKSILLCRHISINPRNIILVISLIIITVTIVISKCFRSQSVLYLIHYL